MNERSNDESKREKSRIRKKSRGRRMSNELTKCRRTTRGNRPRVDDRPTTKPRTTRIVDETNQDARQETKDESIRDRRQHLEGGGAPVRRARPREEKRTHPPSRRRSSSAVPHRNRRPESRQNRQIVDVELVEHRQKEQTDHLAPGVFARNRRPHRRSRAPPRTSHASGVRERRLLDGRTPSISAADMSGSIITRSSLVLLDFRVGTPARTTTNAGGIERG